MVFTISGSGIHYLKGIADLALEKEVNWLFEIHSSDKDHESLSFPYCPALLRYKGKPEFSMKSLILEPESFYEFPQGRICSIHGQSLKKEYIEFIHKQECRRE